MLLTEHARERARERGIPVIAILSAVAFGRRTANSDCERFTLTAYDAYRAVESGENRLLYDWVGVTAVVVDGTIVTTYRCDGEDAR